MLGGTAVAGAGGALGRRRISRIRCRRANAAGSAPRSSPATSTNITPSTAAARPARCASQALPSGRELMRIPVFNRDSATGWGLTNESRKILTEGLLPETRKFLESRGGLWRQWRPAPPAHVVHRRHLRRPLSLRERQGELPGRAHPLRRHEDRQDHRDPQRLGHPWPASAEISRAPAIFSPTANT